MGAFIMELDTAKNSFSDHFNDYRSAEKKKLILSLSITLIFMIIEIIGGLITNSIALISDAGHMFTHSFAIFIGLLAIFIARNPPCHHKTFGLYRAEVLAAFINGLFLLAVVGIMIYEAIHRILNPQEILGGFMFIIAVIGLIANISSILILRGGEENDMNVKGVFYHMIADATASIGIIIASIIISITGWNIIDPIVSICISIIILFWSVGVIKDSTRVLLEMAPKGLDIDTVKEDLMKKFPEIENLYNIHLWTITPEMLVFSCYLKPLKNPNEYQDIENLVSKINKYLFGKYKIIESTIQVTTKEESKVCTD